MPLRTRLKRAFTFGSQDEGTSLSKTPSKSSKKGDPNVYQPGEKLPQLKYRRPVNPEHKEKLEAFSWGRAWRRKSEHSQYSPMGSRMPSRRNSKSTLGRKSMDRRKGSRANEIGVDSGFGGSISGEMGGVNNVREGSDEETDVANVGLSRPPTNDRVRKSSSIGRRSQSIKSGSTRPATASDRARRSLSARPTDQPFTQEELELALRRSHLEAPKEESDRSSEGSPGSPNSRQKQQS